jgi:hypothetical protein
MQHSVKNIGARYEDLSIMRNEKNQFKKEEFFRFAKTNKSKYSIIENNDDLLVSTWYSDSLINDYIATLC